MTNLRNKSDNAAQNFVHCYDVMCDAHSGDNSLYKVASPAIRLKGYMQ